MFTARRFARLHDALIAKLGGRLDGTAPPPLAEDGLQAAQGLLSGTPPPAAVPRAWLSLRADGRVADCNPRAATLFGLRRRGESLTEVARALPRTPAGRQVLWIEVRSGPPVLMQATALPDGRTWHLVEAPPPGSEWLRVTMVAQWRLTPREAALALALLAGGSAETIAAQDGRTLGSVRQSIKGLLAKMGVHSQAQAVARMAALAVAGGDAGTDPATLQPAPVAVRQTVVVGGVPVTVWRHGETGGLPLLFLHGALYGVLGRVQAAAEAALFGFDVIAPVRPGYGEVPLPEGADPVPLALTQAAAVLDALGIDRVLVLAHDVGSVYAFALARAHPARVAGIVCAPVTPPMSGWAQTADMPPLHRVNAFAAQRMPQLMESLVRLGLRRVAIDGPGVIPGLVFADCAHDRAVLASPAAAPVLEHLHDFALEQEARGFIADMLVTNRDWSAWLPQVTCRVALLHGVQSRTVSLAAVRRMAALLPAAELDLVAEAGHTLPLSHPTHPLRAALALAARTRSAGRGETGTPPA